MDKTLPAATEEKYEYLFEQIEEAPPISEGVITKLLEKLRIKDIARQVADKSLDILDGEATYEGLSEIAALIEDTPKEFESPFDEVTTDVTELLKFSEPDNMFKFRLPSLQEFVSGVNRGNLAIIFGRPEVGKSSFVADVCVGFMEQDLKVAYYGNEEPGFKIMLNLVRGKLNKSDTELRAENGIIHPNWEKIKGNLRMYEAVGMGMEQLEAYVKSERPDVVIVDQADKIVMKGSYEAGYQKLKDIYVYLREIAKKYKCFVIAVSQASADAEGKRNISFDMLDGSKTGKAGEADLIIGVGKNPHQEEDNTRFLCVSKNKINGAHGTLTCIFRPTHNFWGV